jgi:hypothetical protein
MKQILNTLSVALAGAALFSACSRPTAYFQSSKTERFDAAQSTKAEGRMASSEIAANVPMTDAAAPTDVPVVVSAETAYSPVVEPQAKQASEALASLKATYATNKRLTKRIERAEQILAEASSQPVAQPATIGKAGLAQRLMLTSLNKKMEKHLAPKDTYATSNYVRIGGIVALVGLLLLLIGNGVGATIGLIALIVGLVMVLLGVINQG